MPVIEKHLYDIESILKKNRPVNDSISAYFADAAERLMQNVEVEKKLNDAYFESMTIESLMLENHMNYIGLMPENYHQSYANPVFTESQFGKSVGQIITFLEAQIRQTVSAAYGHKVDTINRVCELFVLCHKVLVEDKLDSDKAILEIGQWVQKNQETTYLQYIDDTFSAENDLYKRIIMNSDLTDLRYLFKYGHYVSEHEIRTAEFLQKYDEKELDQLARSIVKAYVNGFKRDNKDISLRHSVRIVAIIGQERLTKRLIEILAEYNLNGYVSALISTEFNQQYAFDHKFDKGLYLTEAINTSAIEAFNRACEKKSTVLKDYSGILYVEKFGEDPFSPVNNDARIKLDEAQQKWHQKFQIEQSQTIEKFIPETERSFCIVAFPSPEIGSDFEAIFADVVKINQLDSDLYEKVQQVIIDALDQGEFVHVKGYKGNQTDIKVKLQKLNNPEKETNFVNCVADVNIPVGEVFTSPELKGTSGTLHVDTVYLDNFNYENLNLMFEDGYVKTYTCSNFDDEEKNEEYVRENLLFPHKTLPIGEFAIGTNTLAYVIGEKYGIVDKMPILIVEKMGPHFAIGDTCFSWAEDNPVFNPTDGKEITARDNERSILRKEDVSKAYTNCHTDITIPYDSLAYISVIKADGSHIDIIKEGRFVLEGTEVLNEPFDQYKQ